MLAPCPLTELCVCFQALVQGCPVCSPRSSGQYPLTSLCLSLTQCGTPRALLEPVQAQSPEAPLCSSDPEKRKEGLCSAAARVTPARLAAFTCFTVKPGASGMRLSCRFSGKVRERVEVGGEIRKQRRKNLLSRKVNKPRTCELRAPAVAPLPWTEGISPVMLRQSHCPQTLTGTQRRGMSSPEPSTG